MAAPELTATGMMSLARVQMAPLSPSTTQELSSHGDGATGQLQPMSQADFKFVQHFERCWNRFVEAKAASGELPKGRREMRIEEMQEEIRVLQGKKSNVEGELLKQLAFINSTADSLQYIYGGKMQRSVEHQKELREKLTQRIQHITDSMELQEETLPWLHFLRQLDLQVTFQQMEQQGSADSGRHHQQKHQHSDLEEDDDNLKKPAATGARLADAMRPSDRAMALTDQTQGSAPDIELRAYRTDNALLSTHVNMLRKEIERYEKTIVSQEAAGRFLTQHNVWGILSPRRAAIEEGDEEEEEEDEESGKQEGKEEEVVTSGDDDDDEEKEQYEHKDEADEEQKDTISEHAAPSSEDGNTTAEHVANSSEDTNDSETDYQSALQDEEKTDAGGDEYFEAAAPPSSVMTARSHAAVASSFETSIPRPASDMSAISNATAAAAAEESFVPQPLSADMSEGKSGSNNSARFMSEAHEYGGDFHSHSSSSRPDP